MPVSIFIIAILGAVVLFITGLAVGVWLTTYGFKLGFRSSYQIRGESQDDDKSLFGTQDDSQEFEIAEKENKITTNLMSDEY